MLKRNVALFLTVFLWLGAFPTEAAQAAPTQKIEKLSRRERKERIAKLDETYREFLKVVEPIISPEELNIFLLMESDAQRDRFIEDFWQRRDPDPRTKRNEYKEDYLARRDEALEKYRYLASDRARVLLMRGRPAEMVELSCRYLKPIEIWRYASDPGNKNILLFYDRSVSADDFRLWIPVSSNDREALKELLNPSMLLFSEDSEAPDPIQAVFFGYVDRRGRFRRPLVRECKSGDLIVEAIEWARVSKISLNKVFAPPEVDEQEVRGILRTTVIADPKAKKIDAETTVRFGGRRGERTAAEITVLLDVADLTTKDLGGRSFFNIDVAGEVLKDDKIFENFHYRFDFPVDAGPKLPVAIERHLYPADYTVKIKLLDANSAAQAVVEVPFSVPRVDEIASAPARPDPSDQRTTRMRILPLGDEKIVVGFQRVETIVSGDQIAAVEFSLDGKKLMVKRNPPFTIDLDFGPVPKRHVVRAAGLDSNGRVVDFDEIAVNEGADPFRLRIVSPRAGAQVRGAVRVEMEVRVPEGKSLQQVELFVNEERVATLFAPPFVQTIRVPADTIGYIRAVATATDPSVAPAETLVFINMPEFSERVEVHLVELPTTVLREGKPVGELPQNSFRIFEEGRPVKIERFDYVKNLPLSVGFVIDTSASMKSRLLAAQQAAGEFFRSILRPTDRAFIVTFDREPILVRKWTADLSELTSGLSMLRAEEMTALHDAIVQSLYRFHGVQGQKALIVLTDGRDTASKFAFEQALEYARRSGVPIYAIGIHLAPTDIEARQRLKGFANETGGSAFFIDDPSELTPIYRQIESELRSQYLLAFYPPADVKPGGDWRNIRVEVDGAKVKTIRGYYP